MITGHTKVFALVGHPIHHSLSPAMHNELFRRKRVDAVYVPLEVAPEQADRVGEAVRTLALAGCNLTVPFKERILPALDALDPSAEAAGAVNVVVREAGRLVGHNTDGVGYLRALRDELGVDPHGARAVVLGAGGTGRAVAAALAGAGVAEVRLLNRTLARSEAAVATLGPRFAQTRFSAGPLDPRAFDGVPWDIVVNCVSGPGAAAVAALSVAALQPGSVWTDANYWMADPPQLAACALRGVRIQPGIGMLLSQGALSFELFTGLSVHPDTVRGVLDVGGW